MPQLLGIDLGTSSVKVLLVTEAGQVLGGGSAEYSIRHPQTGWAEQDPDEWWEATITAVRQAVEAAHDPPSIAAIGLSGQMHGTVLLDDRGRPLTPAVIWPDQRSRRQVAEITERVGARHLIELTGSPVATGFQAATVQWMQQEQPALWQQTRQILLPKDYVRWRLTGEYATDPSDGSGSLLLDVRRRDWSPELLNTLGIDRTKLPPVQPSVSIAGDLKSGPASALGLPPGIPVITGAADTACSLLGAGVVTPDTLLLTISTGGQLIVPVRDVRVDDAGRIHTFCGALEPAADRAGWYQMGAILSAGLALRWLRDQVLGLKSNDAYEQMTALAADVPAGARGLLFLPYLVGERTPHMDPQARGMFLGLTLQHGRPELVRAVMEGVALACYDAFSVLREVGANPERIVMAGGGARSRLWQQIVADVFGLPVERLQVTEQSALGAALLAGAGVGMFEPIDAAQAWAGYGPPVQSDAGRQRRYESLLDLFRAAYQKHRNDSRELDDVSENPF